MDITYPLLLRDKNDLREINLSYLMRLLLVSSQLL
jgi:hypothetical protein